jgi:hypothetical protein
MKHLSLWALILCLFGTSKGLAETNDDPNGWYGFFSKTELSKKYSWWTETQLRYNFDAQTMGQTLVRTGLLRSIGRSELGLLYAYIETGEVQEHRLAFQHAMNYGGVFDRFSHRIRYEFRSLEVGGSISDRFRYLLRYAGPKVFTNSSLVVWDEIFLNVDSNQNDQIDHLDRNRFFLGFRIPVKNLSLEVGYLN